MSSQYIRNNFELAHTDGDWELYINRPVYKEIIAYGDYYIINEETGEDCGQRVELFCTIADSEGNLLPEPIYEKNCYKIVKRLYDQ